MPLPPAPSVPAPPPVPAGDVVPVSLVDPPQPTAGAAAAIRIARSKEAREGSIPAGYTPASFTPQADADTEFRMGASRFAGVGKLACLALLSTLGLSCSADKPTAIIVALRAEPKVPLELDGMELRVERNGQHKFDRSYPLRAGDPLPGTITLESEDHSADTIRVTVRAKLEAGGEWRVIREARLGFVEHKSKLLRLPLRYVCLDRPGECGEGKTCIGGECESAEVDSRVLPDFEGNDSVVVRTSPDGGAEEAACFDPRICFANARPVSLPLKGCRFHAPGADGTFNVGMAWKNAPGRPVVLDQDPLEGFQLEGTDVVLAKGLCNALTDGRAVAVVTSTDCPEKPAEAAFCAVVAGVHTECEPVVETCNGVDDDCDGLVDNDLPDALVACPTGNKGVCAAGKSTCIEGKAGCQAPSPGVETCDDGLDGDCDGTVDDGCTCQEGATQPCYSGATGTKDTGACVGGIQTCAGGVFGTCAGEVLPAVETCNGIDDDCDGMVDDVTDATAECAARLLGAGGVASWTCSGGSCAPKGCAAGLLDCDQKPENGCEIDGATDATHCGTCSTACSPVNGIASCTGGKCAVGCGAGLGDCDADASNGCEANLASSVSTCGSCTTACSAVNGVPSCSAGTCAIACSAGFGDCDGDPSNGCETDLTSDVSSCGSCGAPCTVPQGQPMCALGQCTIACGSGFADCDGDVTNGCETDTATNTLDCGSCGTVCVNAHGTTSCVLGGCAPACAAGYADCDGDAVNGCETSTDTDAASCGGCGVVCPAMNGVPSCSSGTCSLSCGLGFADCDGTAANGCETDLQTTPTSCGACGKICSAASGTPSCNGGVCGIGCAANFGDCDGDVSNGCETSLSTSAASCGACGKACTNANGTTTCTGGACVPSCANGFGDCDGDETNGCEASTATDPVHCGGCGTACSTTNGLASCSASKCAITCNPGFGNCDGDVTNGCETALASDATNCGACGTACGATTPLCSGGTCSSLSCSKGVADCDGNAGNGCETNVDADVTQCGVCGNACNSTNGAPSCTGGVCLIACNTGFGDCDENASNGCETDLTTDAASCGACQNACSTANASASCVAGLCKLTCSPGFGDCDAVVANGCEKPLGTIAACGACGTVCSAAGGVATCVAESCTIECTFGFDDCDGDVTNGCEVDVASSASNCGGCQQACSSAGGTPSCSGGICSISCGTGFADCDGDTTNGCEASLSSSNDCGGCGNTCANVHGTTACVGVACTPTCATGYLDCDGNPGNGCETDVFSSTATCGGCAISCGSVNGTATCAAGMCGINCNPGFANCDGNVANGCETDLDNDATHCGNCTNACSAASGTPSCSAGSCSIACNAGSGNCDGDAANGCETATATSVIHCGACNNACSSVNGAPSCNGGSCAIACNTGFGDCNGTAADGCETNLKTDAQHCGACPTACSANNGTPSCVNGTCGIACDTGFANCDGDITNGCETNRNTDTANCGGCGTTCTATNALSSACVTGSCVIQACAAGFADCDAVYGTGCETPLNTISNCGACAKACSSTNGTASCNAGNCSITCSSGFGDCDTNAANGCETPLNTTANCGNCGFACTATNATPTCVAGSCGLGSCTTGYSNCDGSSANGCETNTTNSFSNCGGCNVTCNGTNGTAACINSSCTISACNPGFGNCNTLAADGCEVNTATDSLNCGSCGHSCQGATCVGGLCQTTQLAAAESRPLGIAVDASKVYWTNDPTTTGGDVRSIPLSGGTASVLTTPTGPTNPFWLTLSGSTLFWTVDQSAQTTTSAIMKVSTGGGSQTLLFTGGQLGGITSDATYVYYTTSTSIDRLPTTGGAATTLHSGTFNLGGLAMDASYFYWTDATLDVVVKINRSTQVTTNLASGQGDPMGIAVDASYVYWTNQATGTVVKQALSQPGGTITVVASGQSLPTGLAQDTNTLYWVNRATAGTGKIMKVAK
jgi:hypothetical protein